MAGRRTHVAVVYDAREMMSLDRLGCQKENKLLAGKALQSTLCTSQQTHKKLAQKTPVTTWTSSFCCIHVAFLHILRHRVNSRRRHKKKNAPPLGFDRFDFGESFGMRISIPLDLSSRPFIPLPRSRRPTPLLAPSLFPFPPRSAYAAHTCCV